MDYFRQCDEKFRDDKCGAYVVFDGGEPRDFLQWIVYANVERVGPDKLGIFEVFIKGSINNIFSYQIQADIEDFIEKVKRSKKAIYGVDWVNRPTP